MTQPTQSQEVIADVPCQECGYNLRGLRTDARCPECGIGVWFSLSAPPPLAMAYGPWVRAIRRGVVAIILGYSVLGLLLLMESPASYRLHGNIGTWLVMLSAIVIATGSSYLGRMEPHVRDDAPLLRQVVRWSGWTSALLLTLSILAPTPTLILPAAILVGHQAAVVLYSGALAHRIPSRFLELCSKVVTVLLAACCVGLVSAMSRDRDGALLRLLAIATFLVAAYLSVFLLIAPHKGRIKDKPWSQCTTGPETEQK